MFILAGSHADIKEQQPKFASGEGYQQMVGDRDQKTRDLKGKTGKLKSKLKAVVYEEQEPILALTKFEDLEGKVFHVKGKYFGACEHANKHLTVLIWIYCTDAIIAQPNVAESTCAGELHRENVTS